jgi:hypothetical protein
MLTKFDDYAIHQTPEPIAHPASSDRNVYDRYWFNGFQNDGEFYFAVGMGLYPNRGIIDCGFSVVRDGEQHAFHASKRATGEPADTTVGPFRIEVLEPMMVSRVVLETNETGIECDLTFTARTACVEEGRQTLRQGIRPMLDSTRFAQFGRWHGTLRYDGKTIAVDGGHVLGTKDRSWGLRPVGEPEQGGAPARRLPQIFFLWAPVHWDDHCTHFGVFEDAEGFQLHSDGAFVPAYGSLEEIPGVMDERIRAMASVEHVIEYAPGTRRAKSARLELVERSGQRREISLEPLLTFRMKGIGYTHPEWGHGRWKGELAVGGESWKTADLNELALDNIHIQQVMRARSDGREGIGVLEQICLGPHAPSGFKEFLDGAA